MKDSVTTFPRMRKRRLVKKLMKRVLSRCDYAMFFYTKDWPRRIVTDMEIFNAGI